MASLTTPPPRYFYSRSPILQSWHIVLLPNKLDLTALIIETTSSKLAILRPKPSVRQSILSTAFSANPDLLAESKSETMLRLSPIEHPATAEWGLPITYADYNKLLKGFWPRDMDDKWVIISDTPDAEGNTVVHLARSWTQEEEYALTIEAGNLDETEGLEWGKVTKITWKSVLPGGVKVSEKEALEDAVNFCRGYMGCRLENVA